MKRALPIVLLLMMTGCPDAKSPDTTAPTATVGVPVPSGGPSATAAPEKPAVKGGWTVHIRSSSGSINPDMLPSEEAKARVFFDHLTSVSEEGFVVIDHATLNKSFRIKDDTAALEVDGLMLSIDWAAMVEAVSKDEPSEGGTEFALEVTVGDQSFRVNTANIDAHPTLKELVDHIKKAAGYPQ